MKHSSYFKKLMLLASLLSWILVTVMPVINANNSVGVWATLCTVNGLELVQIEAGNLKPMRENLAHSVIILLFMSLRY